MGESVEQALRAELDDLRARMTQLEAALASASAPGPRGGPLAPHAGEPPPSPEDEAVDRRSLLRRGGIIAGVVAGGAAGALVSASPAAAATVSGSGNPGVMGSGVGGDGVQGFTATAAANGVYGETTSGNAGVRGDHGGAGMGVLGISATGSGVYGNTTGGTSGVLGAHGGSGIGVLGTSTAGVGIKGQSQSAEPGVLGTNLSTGPGVKGMVTATSGVGVAGTSTGTKGTGVEGVGADTGVRGISDTGYGVWGETPNGECGVYGTAGKNGIGVYGTSVTGDGVTGVNTGGFGNGVTGFASAADSFGVSADNAAGPALSATSSSAADAAAIIANSAGGPAVDATSSGHALIVTGGGASTGAHLRLVPTGPAAPTRTGTHLTGEVAEDTAGDLWVCVSGGAPGAWRKLAGPATSGALHALATPVRIYDSRTPGSGGIFTSTTRTIDAKANASGVPAGATAVLVNLAVTNTNSGGFGALWTNGVAWPGTANINWGLAASTLSNSVVTALDATALFQCKIAGTADVIIDVIAYYR